eukprot:4457006-Amphidinium_carterae.1
MFLKIRFLCVSLCWVPCDRREHEFGEEVLTKDVKQLLRTAPAGTKLSCFGFCTNARNVSTSLMLQTLEDVHLVGSLCNLSVLPDARTFRTRLWTAERMCQVRPPSTHGEAITHSIPGARAKGVIKSQSLTLSTS